jgi:hypothetical protein
MSSDDLPYLDEQRKLFERGDKPALLRALHFCVWVAHWPIPPWLEQAFHEAYDASEKFQIMPWDDVFGPPVRKGTKRKRLEYARHKQQIAWALANRVEELNATGPKKMPIEKALQQAGKEFGVGRTVASELYYKVLEEMRDMCPEALLGAKRASRIRLRSS